MRRAVRALALAVIGPVLWSAASVGTGWPGSGLPGSGIPALSFVRPAAAQDHDATLADIRQELSVLWVEIRRLSQELSTTGGAAPAPGGETVLQRVDGLEEALRRLTARTEELENRIERVVRDGTNRIGDLEFRLCELEAACDIGSLGDTPSLGGVSVPEPARPAPLAGDGAQLALGERADFEAAEAALAEGRHEQAAAGFARLLEAYPGSPLTAAAQFGRGEALSALGRTADAARAYLEAFSSAPEGPEAPAALAALGRSLAALGQTAEACVTLGEVLARFPGSREAATADDARRSLGCT